MIHHSIDYINHISGHKLQGDLDNHQYILVTSHETRNRTQYIFPSERQEITQIGRGDKISPLTKLYEENQKRFRRRGSNKTKSFPDVFIGFDGESYRSSERRRKMQEDEISSTSLRSDALTLPREFECTVINETRISSLS